MQLERDGDRHIHPSPQDAPQSGATAARMPAPRVHSATSSALRGRGGQPSAPADLTESERRAEARYRALVAVAGQIVWTSETDSNSASGMAGWCAYTGQRPEATAGLRWLE